MHLFQDLILVPKIIPGYGFVQDKNFKNSGINLIPLFNLASSFSKFDFCRKQKELSFIIC